MCLPLWLNEPEVAWRDINRSHWANFTWTRTRSLVVARNGAGAVGRIDETRSGNASVMVFVRSKRRKAINGQIPVFSSLGRFCLDCLSCLASVGGEEGGAFSPCDWQLIQLARSEREQCSRREQHGPSLGLFSQERALPHCSLSFRRTKVPLELSNNLALFH